MGAALACGTSSGAKPPNILVILTDDQGWPSLGCYGGKIVPTPNLDLLAINGARFTSAYVTSQCTPTRATLLTGQYTARTGLFHVLGGYWHPHARMTEAAFAESLPRSSFNLAKGLRSAGYRTAIVGKWHLGTNSDGNYQGLEPAAARHYGFDFAPPVLSRDAFNPGNDRGVNRLTDQALDFIAANRDKPWFCLLSHHMIHGVVVAPRELEARYRALGYGDKGPNRAVYLAGLEHLDHSMGRLMRRLAELGEADETLVLFLSDNGGIHERLNARDIPNPQTPRFRPDLVEYSNAPLRAGKGSVYEGGVRVPFIAHWPGRVPKGSVIDTPVHAVDLLPTCLAAAGATTPPELVLDGRDLTPLVTRGNDAGLRDRPLFQYCPFYDIPFAITPCASMRRGNHKLIEFFGDRIADDGRYIPGRHLELYDLDRDLAESRNLADALPDVTAGMADSLHRWMRDVGAVMPVPNPRFDQAKAFTLTRKKPG